MLGDMVVLHLDCAANVEKATEWLALKLLLGQRMESSLGGTRVKHMERGPLTWSSKRQLCAKCWLEDGLDESSFPV